MIHPLTRAFRIIKGQSLGHYCPLLKSSEGNQSCPPEKILAVTVWATSFDHVGVVLLEDIDNRRLTSDSAAISSQNSQAAASTVAHSSSGIEVSSILVPLTRKLASPPQYHH